MSKLPTQCPHCQGHQTIAQGSSVDLLFGLGMSVIGLGLLVPALSQSISCYFFAFTLSVTGVAGAYKGIVNAQINCRCNCENKLGPLLKQ